jgi:hypothetical protein
MVASAGALVGFVLATASCLLAVSTMAYARLIGGFPFYDPLLIKIYGGGILLSLAGIGFALSDVRQRGPLR